MAQENLRKLADFGQSIWLDYISRSLIESGRLQRLIDQGLRGMTSNPTIFNQAVTSSSDYDEKIIELHEQGKSIFQIYDELTIADVQAAADLFYPVYEQTKGLDGYVSLEINPNLAMKDQESIREGERLFKRLDRPNVLIKVPATAPGFLVIEELLAKGIPVNVTLIFSLEQYTQTVWAFLKGLKRLGQRQKDLSKIRSVASVFVSRIDTAIDKILTERINQAQDDSTKDRLQKLLGKAAVANARLIFEKFKKMFTSDMYNALATNGAGVQRVLWASTGTKNLNYSDLKYVTELIAKRTINTVPEKTLEAFLDHGILKEAFSAHPRESEQILEDLKYLGIEIEPICGKLLQEGLEAFEKSFEELISSIAHKTQRLCANT